MKFRLERWRNGPIVLRRQRTPGCSWYQYRAFRYGDLPDPLPTDQKLLAHAWKIAGMNIAAVMAQAEARLGGPIPRPASVPEGDPTSPECVLGSPPAS